MRGNQQFPEYFVKLTELLGKHEKDGKFFIALDEGEWSNFVHALRDGRLVFLMMWCREDTIYSLFLESGFKPIGIKTSTSMNRYLALSTVRPAAIVYERMIGELWGKEAMGAVDLRPWLDRGVWEHCWPLSVKPGPVLWPPEAYDYQSVPRLTEKGGSLTVLDPSSFTRDLPVLWRFSCQGERVIKAESLYGYTHRGILSNLYEQNGLATLPVISRINALDTVAHQIAYSHAIEDLAGFIPSLSILKKRVVLSEISRVMAYLLYLARFFRVLEMELIASRCELARELLMRWNASHFGHRWLMDCVFPGTVCADERTGFPKGLPKQVKYWFDQARKLAMDCSGLGETLKRKGVLSLRQAVELNIGGFIGRASGRDTDMRRYLSEYRLEWLSSGNFVGGDVDARIQSWFFEIVRSFDIIENVLRELEEIEAEPCNPQQDIVIECLYGEGIGVCEGVQGDLWYFVKLEAGKIKDVFIRDPAIVQAYVLQELLQGTTWRDQTLVRASFGMLTTGADL